MSTPTGRPDRPASVFDYAPKHVREQWNRDEVDDAADAEFADDPPISEDDPAQAESDREADERVSSLVPKGAHEDADHEADDAEYSETQSWERDDADGEPDATEERRTEDWLDELEYRAELRERRAKAAEMDREYEDQLERLAASLRTLRDEDGESEPDGETLRGRSPPPPDAAERDLYIEGVRLPRFLQSQYVPPPARGEGGSGWLGFVLAGAIACAVGVPLSYYFYSVGLPFASKPGQSQTKSEVQYSIASVSDRLPKLEQTPVDASPAPPPPPAAVAPEPATQAQPKPDPALPAPAAQADQSQTKPAPRRVPLTHVMRWPDQAPDSAAPQPPRAPSLAAPAPSARSAVATITPPDTPNALAFAPAVTPPPPAQHPKPAPPQTVAAAPPALPIAPQAAPVAPQATPARPSAGDTDEVQLLLKQGQDFVAAGDLATARVVLRRAAEAGVPAAALALGQTYDPKVLAKMRARGVTPNLEQARHWYETAQKLGSREAAQQLARLDGNE